MDDRDYDDIANDKQWAAKYILGPLYDPEPSQVCATRFTPLPPTPQASASPPRRRLSHKHRRVSADEDDEEQPFLRRLLSRSNSINSKCNKPLAPPPPPPPRSRYPPLSGLERKRSVHTSNPPQTRWNQGTILTRSNSVGTSRPSANNSRPGPTAMAPMKNQDRPRRRAGSFGEGHTVQGTQGIKGQERGDARGWRRAGSLRERYPGDMSHRPLDMLKRDYQAADRAPHLHNHRRQQPSDTIDSLDLTGPIPGAAYHHSGPFDATMKERNKNKIYAPVEAVRGTNMEALKATPAEFLQDSLIKHVPLQGTAIVPPGMKDMSGRTMEYEEGADLMRESDAAGGAYKRWDHVVKQTPRAKQPRATAVDTANTRHHTTQRYRDDDLKGKGEPSFSLDQARREQKARGKQLAHNGPVFYEMQPPSHPHAASAGGKLRRSSAHVRQRSVSNGAQHQAMMNEGVAGSSGLQRSNTTGKSIAQSLKRRFGSLRWRKGSDEVGY
ncbi:Protein pal1 [Madurella mycetomatis]|uniref:Protein pal1 n=1 Tax=Madurella mycetomatis TaxID=100816 RepID=A0A175WB30_9PEZI|nr:Protein pal1 [Madurella mycetomatis]